MKQVNPTVALYSTDNLRYTNLEHPYNAFCLHNAHYPKPLGKNCVRLKDSYFTSSITNTYLPSCSNPPQTSLSTSCDLKKALETVSVTTHLTSSPSTYPSPQLDPLCKDTELIAQSSPPVKSLRTADFAKIKLIIPHTIMQGLHVN